MEDLKWYDHIELAGLFLTGVWFVGSLVYLMLQRWLQRAPCEKCVALVRLPVIEEKQVNHRAMEHLQLEKDIVEIKGDIKLVLEKIEHINRLS